MSSSADDTMMTAEKVDEFKEAFSLFDRDGRGTIASSDLGTVLNCVELSPTQDELTDMINEIDDGGGGGGAIDFPLFLTLAARVAAAHPVSPEETIHEAMKKICGIPRYISTADLRTTLASQGCTAEEIEQIVLEVDADGSGSIDSEKFFEKMKREASGTPTAKALLAQARDARRQMRTK